MTMLWSCLRRTDRRSQPGNYDRAPERFFGVDGHVGNTPLIRFQLAGGLLLFVRDRQSAVKKFRGGAVRAEPIVPTEQVVNFGGDHLKSAKATFGRAVFRRDWSFAVMH